jgi:hypothetical protein
LYDVSYYPCIDVRFGTVLHSVAQADFLLLLL